MRTTWNEYALNHYFIGDCSTDDALKGGNGDGDRSEVRDLSDFTVYTTNGEVGRRWEILYRLVNRCNDVIYYAPKAQGDKELLARYVLEAKALRAFGYYCLVTSFGDVPLITEPKLPSEVLTIPRSSSEEVYKQIIQDLEDASDLPAKNEYAEADVYRVTRGFAKTMLAKTYMFRGDFVSAETVLHDIVEVDKDYELLDNYGWNWFPEYENSSESIFELPNKVYDKNIGTGTNVPHFSQVVLQLGMMDMVFMFRQRICMMLSIRTILVSRIYLRKQVISMWVMKILRIILIQKQVFMIIK